ncbi:unnamed protein product, partial [Durusdinium trenchii]
VRAEDLATALATTTFLLSLRKSCLKEAMPKRYANAKSGKLCERWTSVMAKELGANSETLPQRPSVA